MKLWYRTALGGALVVLILLFCGSVSAQTRVSIGAVGDGPWERNASVFPLFIQEINDLLGDEFDVSLSAQHLRLGDWTLDGISQAVDSLLADPEVDIVLTVGPIGSAYACRLEAIPKPVIAAFVFDAEVQGLPQVNGTSGVRNLAYVSFPSTLRADVQSFLEVVDFDTLTILATDGLIEAAPELVSNTAEELSGLGVEVEIVRVANTLDDVLPQIENAEAVFVFPLMQLDSGEFDRLVDQLIDWRIPSFSVWGRSEVERGLFMTGYPDTDFQRTARRVALNIQRILLGERPENIRVTFARSDVLVLNMATARAINVYPSWGTLTEAELLHEDRSDAEQVWMISTAIDHAVEENLELARSAIGLEAVAQEVALARSNLLPQIDISGQGRIIDIDRARASAGSAPQYQFTATAGLDQVIYSEQAFANLAIQNALLLGEEYAQEALRLDVAEATGIAYLNVLRAQTFERIQRQNLAQSRAHLELARIRETIGSAGPGDVYRWEAEIATNRQDVISANAQRNLAEIALNQLMRRPLEEPFQTVEEEAGNPLILQTEAMQPYIGNPWRFRIFRNFLVDLALEESPELRQLEALISARERALVAAQRSYYIPTAALFAEGSWDVDGGEGTEGFSLDLPEQLGGPVSSAEADHWNWVVGLGFSLPIYSGGSRPAQIRQHDAQLAELRAQRASVEQRIEQRTRSAVPLAGASYAGIALAEEAATAAGQNLSLVTDAYARGAVSIVELIDAQQAHHISQEVAANAVFDFMIDFLGAQRSAGCIFLLLSPAENAALFARVVTYIETAEQERDQ